MKYKEITDSKGQNPIAIVLFKSTPEKNDEERLKNALFFFVERAVKPTATQEEIATLPQVAGLLRELIRKK